MKTYAPTLKKVKGNWYVSMTVPPEPRAQLGGQIRRSTGTSDKNEAKKRTSGIAIEIQARISAAEKTSKFLEFQANISKIARELGRYDEFDFDNADHFNLNEIAVKLSRTSDSKKREFGTFNINALQKQFQARHHTVERTDPRVQKMPFK